MTPNDHAEAERIARDHAIARYAGMSRAQLLREQEIARESYRQLGATQEAVAACMVLAVLLAEIEPLHDVLPFTSEGPASP